MLAALIAGQSVSFLIFADERRAALRAANREQVLARTAGLVRLLEETPESAASAGSWTPAAAPLVRFRLAPSQRGDGQETAWHGRNRVARRLAGLLDGNGGRAVLADFRRRAPDRQPDRLRAGRRRDRPAAARPPTTGRRMTLHLAVQLRRRQLAERRDACTGPPPAWALPSLVSLALSASLVGARRSCSRSAGHPADDPARSRGRCVWPGRGPPLPANARARATSARTVAAFNRMQDAAAPLRRRPHAACWPRSATTCARRSPRCACERSSSRTRRPGTGSWRRSTRCRRWSRARWLSPARRPPAEPTRVVDLAALIESTVVRSGRSRRGCALRWRRPPALHLPASWLCAVRCAT